MSQWKGSLREANISTANARRKVIPKFSSPLLSVQKQFFTNYSSVTQIHMCIWESVRMLYTKILVANWWMLTIDRAVKPVREWKRRKWSPPPSPFGLIQEKLFKGIFLMKFFNFHCAGSEFNPWIVQYFFIKLMAGGWWVCSGWAGAG